MSEIEKKEVFVTYSWEGEEHNDKVLSFTNHLRKNGFIAEIDILFTQNESATDFYKMMHQGMTDYNKVIIILSKGYKIKAEQFKGGVGNEYNLILKDIEFNKTKYVLVSFEPISDEITPLNFKGRHIFDLSEPSNYNELYAKLQDVKTIEFIEVAKEKPEVRKKVIPDFEEALRNNLEIANLLTEFNGSSQVAQLYTKINYLLSLELINNSTLVLSDYTVEISYPAIHGSPTKEVIIENSGKIFPTQKKKISIGEFEINNRNVEEFLKSSIKVKVFTDFGTLEKDFDLGEVLSIKSKYGIQLLTKEMFHERNYR